MRLAQEAAGPGEDRPTEGKARLARARLAQPEGLAEALRAELGTFPADHPDVAALRARVDAATAAIARLRARLDGTPAAPTAPPPGSPEPTTRLDYRQAKELADARFYADEVAGLAGALDVVVKDAAAAPDPDAFDHRRLVAAKATAERAVARAKLAHDHLDPLPPGGAGVADVRTALATATAAAATAWERLAPLAARVATLVDPANYPALGADVARLEGLARMFADPAQAFGGRRAAAAARVEAVPAARAEGDRIAAVYAPLVRQQTAEGVRVEAASRFFRDNLAAFAAAAAAAAQAMPSEADAAFAELARRTETAVRERKPAFFAGGIPQQMKALDELVTLWTALDPVAGQAARVRLDAARADLATRREALRGAIIEANELPPDAYAGPDRADLERAATATWTAVEAGAKVLAVRIPSRAWVRETMWRYENRTWRLIDRSHLQAQLLVAHADGLVAIRPVDLWIDHVDGDARRAFPMDAPGDALPPERLLRADKVR